MVILPSSYLPPPDPLLQTQQPTPPHPAAAQSPRSHRPPRRCRSLPQDPIQEQMLLVELHSFLILSLGRHSLCKWKSRIDLCKRFYMHVASVYMPCISWRDAPVQSLQMTLTPTPPSQRMTRRLWLQNPRPPLTRDLAIVPPKILLELLCIRGCQSWSLLQLSLNLLRFLLQQHEDMSSLRSLLGLCTNSIRPAANPLH